MPVVATVALRVATEDAELRFGIDESYAINVSVSAASVTLSAQTVFGGVWALETLSQLVHRVWTTDADGALSGSYYRVCSALVSDAPRFPFRSLLLDTSRHFMTTTVIKQVVSYLTANRVPRRAAHTHATIAILAVNCRQRLTRTRPACRARARLQTPPDR
jgi:hexosaminidase